MNETELPTDLQHEVAARAPQPGFDAVMDRADAHRRRRRTTIASGLGAAVVVAGLAAVGGGLVGDDGRTPQPADPSPTTPWDGTSTVDGRLPSDVVAVLDDDRLQLWSITGGDDGATAALWRGCDFDPCRFALVVRNGDDVHGEALGASYPTVTRVPDGWLVADARGASLLSTSGERSEVVDTGPGGSSDVMAGDTAVPTVGGWRLLRGTKLIPMPEPIDHPHTVWGAWVTGPGSLVVAVEQMGRVEVLTTDDSGASWGAGGVTVGDAGASGAVLAGNGDHVAVVALGDDPDGSIPVQGVQVSHDAGRTWVPTVNLDLEGGDRVADLSSLAVGADGTTYLTTGSHHLVRIDDEGFATPVQLSAADTGVFASGDQVCLVAERGRHDALLCSPDGLTDWVDQPLPGLR